MAKFLKPSRSSATDDDEVDSREPSWFSRGEEAAATARQQAKASYRPEFWLTDGECADVIFLDKESFNIWQHQIKQRGRVRKYTCLRRGCPLCKLDEPRVSSVYRILDLRIFAPKDGKKANAKPVDKFGFKQKYLEVGARLQPTVAKLLAKGRLYKQVCEISRDGTGTSTTYQIIPSGEIDDTLRAALVKRGLLKNELKFEEDFAPKSREDLAVLVDMLGGMPEEDEDYRPAAKTRASNSKPSRRSYFEDVDEDDENTSGDEDED